MIHLELQSLPHFTDFESFLNGDIKGKKIGIPREYRLDGMSNEIEKLWSDGMKMLEEAGAEIIDISLNCKIKK